ncbi:TetR/AcrR family transcriptional regulator [Paenibacillus sp. KQZ6P-2]|uniref:TetR/AcrR family transcriptional regulator n=1 Tax=Paenibacillus mangrovi TaxID=2931978 RepID=A0A9X2B305_9BACL|nr:TetR/AcrR family transcriptional regulator [Paenibacillus mangrovi]MCJ8012826.1 TetR/AcrR family transcriptional regulator [Paenibacillus mangrovi]
MSEKLADKKKQILKTALQLFSTKGISSTSMQEIAEYCGMSKGSLYLHFKSKEELEKSIYLYCEGMVRDSIMQVEQEHLLTPKEQLHKQVEVLLNRLVELREFVIMQLRDQHTSGKMPGLNECIREKHIHRLHWFHNKLVMIYGQEIQPHTMDLTMFVTGMLGGYVRTLMVPGLPLNVRRMAEHLITLLDDVVASTLRERREPLISTEIWSQWMEKYMENPDRTRHPLMVTKQMKDLLKEISMDEASREFALESIQIIEKELLDIEPRKAILSGMMSNLEQIPELSPLSEELKEIYQLYVNSRTDRT